MIDRLHKSGLKVNTKNIISVLKEITYIVYIITCKGIKPDTQKL